MSEYQNCAAAPGQESVPCLRCGGTGFYQSFGECWRCRGTGRVAMSRVSAYFQEQRQGPAAVAAPPARPPAQPRPAPPAPPEQQLQLELAPPPVRGLSFRQAGKAAAIARAQDLRAEGYRGRIRAFEDRVELLCYHRSRPGETRHLTWFPHGAAIEVVEEWLPGRPSANWPHILHG